MGKSYFWEMLELSESTAADKAAAARCFGEKYDVILGPDLGFSLGIDKLASWESSEPLLTVADALGVAERIREDLLVAIDSSA